MNPIIAVVGLFKRILTLGLFVIGGWSTFAPWAWAGSEGVGQISPSSNGGQPVSNECSGAEVNNQALPTPPSVGSSQSDQRPGHGSHDTTHTKGAHQ